LIIGTDLADQNRKYYGIQWTSRNDGNMFYIFVLNAEKVNIFILYNQANRPACISHWETDSSSME
jgi:hypothetical protein